MKKLPTNKKSVKTGKYALKAAALAAGLTPATLRAWEARYGVVQPDRSRAGHRRYTQEAVTRLQVLAGLVRKGHAISQLATMSDLALQKMAGDGARAVTEVHAEKIMELRLQALLAAVRRYDLTEAMRATKWLRTVAGARSFVLDVAVPLFRILGELVSAGTLDVSQEHALSAILRDQLGDLLHAMPVINEGPQPPKIVFAAPEDDWHEFGILLGGVLAAARGFDVLYAGANMPVAGLQRILSTCKPVALVLGNAPVPPSERRCSFADYLLALDDLVPAGIEILVGGQGDRPMQTCPSGRSFRYVNSLQELDEIFSQRTLQI